MPPVYNNPLKQVTQSVNGESYKQINFNDELLLLWPSQIIQDAEIENFVASLTHLNGYIEDAVVFLPKATLNTPGATFVLKNISAYDIQVKAADGTAVVTLASASLAVKFTLISQSESIESECWDVYVFGAATNTNTLSQNLGRSLRFISSTNNVQQASSVNTIANSLTNNGAYYSFTNQQLIDLTATTLVNPATINQQVNILLPPSQAAYALSGFECTFANEGSTPIVLQTQGDTINGFPLRSTLDTASFVISPGSAVTIASSSNTDYIVTSEFSQFQNVFKTASLNLGTANYIYLQEPAGFEYSLTTIVNSGVGTGIAIDMSTNLDLVYSPIWYINGDLPSSIKNYMQQRGQTTVWIILPNNLSYIYFLQGRSTGQYKIGIACKYSSTGVALPPLMNAYSNGPAVTLPFQFSAQLTLPSPQVSIEFVSSLLISTNVNAGVFPDILDVNNLVTITGIYGLTVLGPANLASATVAGQAVATKVSPNASQNILIAGMDGNLSDSGVRISLDPTMGGATPSNAFLSSQKAIVDFINLYSVTGLQIQGAWNAASNTPALASGVGVINHAYTVTTGGTQTILDPIVYPPSGSYTFIPGDTVYFGANGEWSVIPFSGNVTSINGQVGTVTLPISGLSDVVITSILDSQVLTWDNGSNRWVNRAPALLGIVANGVNVTFSVPFITSSSATISSFLNVSGQATFGTASPASQNPPLFIGAYPPVLTGNELVTIDILDQIVTTPTGIATSGVSGSVYWVKYFPDVNGKELIEQWGVVSVTTTTSVTLGIPFTASGTVAVNLTVKGSVIASDQLTWASSSLATLQLTHTATGTVSVSFIARGY